MKLEKLKNQQINFITKTGERKHISFKELWLTAHKNSKSKLTAEKFLLVNRPMLENEWNKIRFFLDRSIAVNNLPFYKRWLVVAKQKIRALFTKKTGV